MCPGSFAVASPTFTRTDMVKQIYKQFGIHEEYVVGVQVGPPFKVWFTGMEYISRIFSLSHMSYDSYGGRKEKVPVIESDANWTEFQRRLLNKKEGKNYFLHRLMHDVDILVPYKCHLHACVRV